mmetsp:Transcript_15135/g.45251  ORF Transcript_15135/g.45251 Transcript_15135/m.45251 type:complete len:271 (-) Transcript_15135:2-814(-)
MAKPRRSARTKMCDGFSSSRPCVSRFSSSRMSSISFADSRDVGGARMNSGCGAATSTKTSPPSSKPSFASSSASFAFRAAFFARCSFSFAVSSAFACNSAVYSGYLASCASSNSTSNDLKSARHRNESRWNASAGNSSLDRICVATFKIEKRFSADAAGASSSTLRRWSGTKLSKNPPSAVASFDTSVYRRSFSAVSYVLAPSNVMRARAASAASAAGPTSGSKGLPVRLHMAARAFSRSCSCAACTPSKNVAGFSDAVSAAPWGLASAS